jgi:hypothetical protein
MNLTGSAQTTDPETFMLNDSTVCTSLTNVIRTANEIKMLKAQRDYLVEGKAVETVDKRELNKTLRKVRLQLFWQRASKPLVIAGSTGVGYVVGRIIR